MAKKNIGRGLFITFEGADGSGKSTHGRLLYEYLAGMGYDCVFTREPGGTKLGEAIRGVLLHSDDVDISSLAELFLFEAARSQVVEEVIRPNLMKKRIVICDRFYDATLAYQGYGGGVSIKSIKLSNGIAAGRIKPDLTILLDIDTATGLKRACVKGFDRMENKKIDYHRRIRAGYLKIAGAEPKRFRIIGVKGAIGRTQALVRREVEHVIQRYKRAG